MKFIAGFVLGAAGMFGVWWYVRYIELKEAE
jgi:hypothetical protein